MKSKTGRNKKSDNVALKCKPSLMEFKRLARRGNVIPVRARLSADLETPVSALLKLRQPQQHAFLFESVEGAEHMARYSFVGARPAAVLTGCGGFVRVHWYAKVPRLSKQMTIAAPDMLDAMRTWMRQFRYVRQGALPRFCGGLLGYIGYEAIAQWEPVAKASKDPLKMPELSMMLADSMVIFDHTKHQMMLMANALLPPQPKAIDMERAYTRAVHRVTTMEARLRYPVRVPTHETVRKPRRVSSNMTQKSFETKVRAAKAHIRAGDIIQVVLSQRFARKTAVDPVHVFRSLRALNPSPYMFYISTGRSALVGSSPELLVRLEGQELETRPIAGTRPRGATAAKDRALAKELLQDPKERAEHLMLVDLGRNDLGRVAKAGTVGTPDFCVVERYSHVMHLVSRVVAIKQPKVDAFDAIRAAFPAGTVSGAPKVRAMQIIADLERDRRGPYAGAVGYIGFSGNMDTCITIRTILIKDGVAYVQAGAGIVADSRPANEYQETVNKAAGMLAALTQAES